MKRKLVFLFYICIRVDLIVSRPLYIFLLVILRWRSFSLFFGYALFLTCKYRSKYNLYLQDAPGLSQISKCITITYSAHQRYLGQESAESQ